MDAKKEKPVSIPNGFKCSDKGVIFIKEDKDGSKTDQPVTFKEIKVTALSRDGLSDNWGRLVIWKDHDDKKHEMAIPSAMFHATGNDLAQKLADGGLPIVPGCERHLLRYLTAFIPHDRLIAATSTGWHGDAFVLPLETINEPEGERIVFQPAGLSNTSKAIHRKGTLSGWQAAVKTRHPSQYSLPVRAYRHRCGFPARLRPVGFIHIGAHQEGRHPHCNVAHPYGVTASILNLPVGVKLLSSVGTQHRTHWKPRPRHSTICR